MTRVHGRRLQWAAGLSLVVLALLLGLMDCVGLVGGNIRVVDAGRVYRSAQLSGPRLTDCLRSYGIRSVINLQGYHPGDAALRDERAVCARLGIAHRDISLSAGQLPPPVELRRLLQALDSLPRPVLIHCRGGADRTGLACTLYLSIYGGVPLHEAESRQLTWRYGHLASGPAHPMDDFFALYRQTGEGQPLREWITSRYPKLYAEQTRGGKSP